MVIRIHVNQSMDQPGKVANPARGQLNREKNDYFPVPVRSRLRIWFRETGSTVPSPASACSLLYFREGKMHVQ